MSIGLKATKTYLEARVDELQRDFNKHGDFALKAKIDTFKAILDLLDDDSTERTTCDDFFVNRHGVEL